MGSCRGNETKGGREGGEKHVLVKVGMDFGLIVRVEWMRTREVKGRGGKKPKRRGEEREKGGGGPRLVESVGFS